MLDGIHELGQMSLDLCERSSSHLTIMTNLRRASRGTRARRTVTVEPLPHERGGGEGGETVDFAPVVVAHHSCGRLVVGDGHEVAAHRAHDVRAGHQARVDRGDAALGVVVREPGVARARAALGRSQKPQHARGSVEELLVARRRRPVPSSVPTDVDIANQVSTALSREPSPHYSHPAPRDRIEWIRELEPVTGPRVDDEDEAWSAFASRADLERLMTGEVKLALKMQTGIHIPAG